MDTSGPLRADRTPSRRTSAEDLGLPAAPSAKILPGDRHGHPVPRIHSQADRGEARISPEASDVQAGPPRGSRRPILPPHHAHRHRFRGGIRRRNPAASSRILHPPAITSGGCTIADDPDDVRNPDGWIRRHVGERQSRVISGIKGIIEQTSAASAHGRTPVQSAGRSGSGESRTSGRSGHPASGAAISGAGIRANPGPRADHAGS